MIITYHGIEFFKLQHGDFVIAINPIAKSSEAKASRFGADIALVTTNHSDMNGVEQLSHAGKEPFIIKGPGEYEVGGIQFKGIETKTKYKGVERFNTVYFFTLDGIRVCFLGALDNAELPEQVHENAHGVDVLFVPAGGEGVLGASEAHKLAVRFEPRLIIPMHYTDKSIRQFIEEAGDEKVKTEEKITIKKKDLEEKSGEIVVLSS